MGCEAHPDTDGRTFICRGNPYVVFNPYFVSKDGTEYPHANGASAFPGPGEEVPTHALLTSETVLTDVPGKLRVRLAEVAVRGLQAVREAA